MPLSRTDAAKLVRRRHPEWQEHWPSWCRLYDSLEGGDRYRYADYAVPPDSTGLRGHQQLMMAFRSWDAQTGESRTFDWDSVVARNLVPHRSEMSEDGYATYAMRLSRTPPPTEFSRAIESHLSRVFSEDIDRSGPPELEAWWEDVDGRGTTIRQFMENMAGPLLLAMGQIDVAVDHPQRPADVPADAILSRADQAAYGLDLAVPSVILPENVLWWRLDNRGQYVELLTLERDSDPEPDERASFWYRHWTPSGSDAYDPTGNYLPDKSYTHPYGRIPVVRLFDRRKPRCSNVGKSRYEGIANLQRAAYNAESERVLADVMHSHPTMQIPVDASNDGKTIRIGPTGVIPMIALSDATGGVSGYQGAEFLDPPTGAQAALREHVVDYRDSIDREAALAKPAGLATGSTVAQSGVSKVMDSVDGNAVLCRVSEVLENAERAIAKLAMLVLTDGANDDPQPFEIEYPKQFDLYTVEDVAAVLDTLQAALSRAGAAPVTEAEIFARLIQVGIPGLEENLAKEMKDELRDYADEAARLARQPVEPTTMDPSTDGTDQQDPGRTDQGSVGLRPPEGEGTVRVPGA